MMDEISAQADSQPAKRKRGRQPGSPNPKSHYKPPRGMKPAELRRWIIENTKVLENLLRMADGKRVQLHGPTGKTYWADGQDLLGRNHAANDDVGNGTGLAEVRA